MFIDTHGHLYLKQFSEDIELVTERFLKANVQKVILPNIDNESLPYMNELTERKPEVFYPTIGLHPSSVGKDFERDLRALKDEWRDEKYIGVGEIGLDFYWDITHREEQIEAFRKQLSWAREWKLPVIIHARKSLEIVIDVVQDYVSSNVTGVFHCFSGTVEQAQKVIDMGFMIGVGGVLTYKNSTLRKVVANVDIEKILLETDAPYLPPVPFRGKRNEPAYLPIIADSLAAIKNLSVDDVETVTTENARFLFGL